MKKLMMLLLLVVIGILCAGLAYGAATTATVNTATKTEHNTATPTISITCAGNYSHFLASIYTNGTALAWGLRSTPLQVVNNTATNIVLQSHTGGYNYSVKVGCVNQTSMLNSSVSVQIVNYRPTVVATDNDNNYYLTLGKTVTFTGTITDLMNNAAQNDRRNMAVCKTDVFSSNACTGGAWCTNATNSSTTALTCKQSIVSSLTAGTKNYYIYVWDNNQYASASSSSGNFKISGRGSIGDGVFDQPPALESTETKTDLFAVASGSSEQTKNELGFLTANYWGIPLFILIIGGIILVVIMKRRRR